MSAADLAGLPPQIGRYEVQRLLGRGGMGRVVAGFDPVLRREVAIKVVEPGVVSLDDLPELRFMFHREARATAALRHPNVVEVFDYSGPDADLMYIACELVEGPTLYEVLRKRGALPVRVACAIAYELAAALGEAHRQSIVHRDLKPENVFWTPQGRIVLSDFGIAKAFDGHDRLGGTIQFGSTNLYGSPLYIAPEQLVGSEVGPHTDIYALGVVLYECMSGHPPAGGEDLQNILSAVAEGRHQPLRSLVSVPNGLDALVESMLSLNPSQRPHRVEHVGHRLRELLDHLDVTDPRLVLRDHGHETQLEVEAYGEEDDDHTEIDRRLYSGDQALPVIRARPQASRWAQAATRGPATLAMLTVALAIGAGAYLFTNYSDLLNTGQLGESAPTISTNPDRPVSSSEQDDVFVLLTFPSRTTIYVDDQKVGTWERSIRLALAPGRHTVEGHSAQGTVKREILLIRGTQPTFDLTP